MTINWIKMEDQLPPVNTPVLIRGFNEDICVAALEHEPNNNWLWWNPVGFLGYEWDWNWEDIDHPFRGVTHWMPLPPPPVTGASK